MFWKHVCSWAMINGVKKMECTVSPAMERILKSVGFKQQYIKMRQDLWAEA
jgi:N-acyl-L-homoserine lactone synthetase